MSSKEKLTTKLTATEAALKKWQTRLKRAANTVNDLDRYRRRLQLQLLTPDQPVVAVVKMKKGRMTSVEAPPYDTPETVAVKAKQARDVTEQVAALLDIPADLNRADPLIAEKMTKARKEAEAEARKAMPLSGRAAMLHVLKKDGKKEKARRGKA